MMHTLLQPAMSDYVAHHSGCGNIFLLLLKSFDITATTHAPATAMITVTISSPCYISTSFMIFRVQGLSLAMYV